jgi:hypothetical protein
MLKRAERYIQLNAYLVQRRERSSKECKDFYSHLIDRNDRRFKSELKLECERYGDELIETAKRLRR